MLPAAAAGSSATSSARTSWTAPTSRCCWSSPKASSAAGASTGRRRTWCCPPCGTGPPNSATGCATYQRRHLPRGAARRSATPVTVCHPTSHAAARLRQRAAAVAVLPAARASLTPREEFAAWAARPGGRGRRLLMEDFYRWVRGAAGLLMDGDEPAGGRWNLDAENREPPADAARPLRAVARRRGGRGEDDIDAQVRRRPRPLGERGDVSFVGGDGPRLFPATRAEALARAERLRRPTGWPTFGPYEDAMLAGDPWMAHSLLSRAAEPRAARPAGVRARGPSTAYRAGTRAARSVEGFVRQVIGWRDYVWHAVLALRRGLPAPQRPARTGGRCPMVRRAGRRRRRRRAACPRCCAACATAAGCTTSRG